MELTRCGSNGATCNTCAASQSCQLGVCLNSGGGGGGSYGNDGGCKGEYDLLPEMALTAEAHL